MMKLLQRALLGLLCGMVGVSTCAAQIAAQQATSVSGKFRAESSDNDDWKQITVSLIPMAEAGESSTENELFRLWQQGGSTWRRGKRRPWR